MATELTMSDKMFCNSITPSAEAKLIEEVRRANKVISRLHSAEETSIPQISLNSTASHSLLLVAVALIPFAEPEVGYPITTDERNCLNVVIGHIKSLFANGVDPAAYAVIEAHLNGCKPKPKDENKRQ